MLRPLPRLLVLSMPDRVSSAHQFSYADSAPSCRGRANTSESSALSTLASSAHWRSRSRSPGLSGRTSRLSKHSHFHTQRAARRRCRSAAICSILLIGPKSIENDHDHWRMNARVGVGLGWWRRACDKEIVGGWIDWFMRSGTVRRQNTQYRSGTSAQAGFVR